MTLLCCCISTHLTFQLSQTEEGNPDTAGKRLLKSVVCTRMCQKQWR